MDGGISEGHRTVVVGARFSCEHGDVVDTDNRLVNVAPTLTVVVDSGIRNSQ